MTGWQPLAVRQAARHSPSSTAPGSGAVLAAVQRPPTAHSEAHSCAHAAGENGAAVVDEGGTSAQRQRLATPTTATATAACRRAAAAWLPPSQPSALAPRLRVGGHLAPAGESASPVTRRPGPRTSSGRRSQPTGCSSHRGHTAGAIGPRPTDRPTRPLRLPAPLTAPNRPQPAVATGGTASPTQARHLSEMLARPARTTPRAATTIPPLVSPLAAAVP